MNILKLELNRYVAFFRDRYAGFIYRSTSADGCGWSSPVATVLPNNNASIQAASLKNGDIVMAFDNTRGPSTEHKTQTGPRAPLSVAISPDRGLTWSAIRDLEIPDRIVDPVARSSTVAAGAAKLSGVEEYSYPSIVPMPDGKILVAYTYRRVAIKAVLFDENWIRRGNTVGLYKPGQDK